MTDTDLIEGILQRDRKAFQYLVDTYQHRVVKTAFYFVGNMEDAEDLSQEIFLEVINSVKSFRNSSSLATWIYRITVNKSLNVVKKQQRKGILLRLESLFMHTGDNMERSQEPVTHDSSFEDKEKKLILQTAINRLPKNQRIAFILHKYDDQSYKEIATLMNVGIPAVESLMHRAKINLQKLLINQFSDYYNK